MTIGPSSSCRAPVGLEFVGLLVEVLGKNLILSDYGGRFIKDVTVVSYLVWLVQTLILWGRRVGGPLSTDLLMFFIVRRGLFQRCEVRVILLCHGGKRF